MDQCKCVRQTREGEAADLSKCPFCGSEAKGPESTRWLCGTVMDGPRQSDTCRIWELEADLEQTRVRLAGCASAAQGHISDPATPDMYGWSPAYQDVLDLRRRADELEAIVARQSEEIEAATLRVCELTAEVAAFTALEAQLPPGYAIGDDATVPLAIKCVELEAEVAARVARCALLAVALNVAHDSLDPLSGCAASISQMITETLATPDLAASRLLAGDALAAAQVRLSLALERMERSEAAATEWNAASHDAAEAEVAYRAAVAAEGEADAHEDV